ncbi:hypothetical protein Srubr_27820 [Streptomyces rubradiris]|uniref:Uncharacterized protein n=1 Tax=Streptomyces rubradiris TaxID=285531 RepID=A0ABQ3RAQ6_STRRR|nr:hypothetical protein GCM10018792_50700 [Streptomyces rubradiris]GHI52936.1 hypothetical protein Srubr_27820 [Streptomyces rubradiris]
MTSLSVHLTVSIRLANRAVQVPLREPDFIVLVKRRHTLAADETTGYGPRTGWEGRPGHVQAVVLHPESGQLTCGVAP